MGPCLGATPGGGIPPPRWANAPEVAACSKGGYTPLGSQIRVAAAAGGVYPPPDRAQSYCNCRVTRENCSVNPLPRRLPTCCCRGGYTSPGSRPCCCCGGYTPLGRISPTAAATGGVHPIFAKRRPVRESQKQAPTHVIMGSFGDGLGMVWDGLGWFGIVLDGLG